MLREYREIDGGEISEVKVGEEIEIVVYDLAGSQIYNDRFRNRDAFKFSFPELGAGSYMIKVTSGKEEQIQRFVVY